MTDSIDFKTLAKKEFPDPDNSKGEVIIPKLAEKISEGPSLTTDKQGQLLYREALLESLKGRMEKGGDEHGSFLATFNNRPMLVDGFQELLDAATYFMGAAMEADYEGETKKAEFIESIVFDILDATGLAIAMLKGDEHV